MESLREPRFQAAPFERKCRSPIAESRDRTNGRNQPLALENHPAPTRLLRIASVIARHPGLDFEELLWRIQEASGKPWRESTIRNELTTLRQLGLLGPGVHRRGYFLAGSGYRKSEETALLNALRIQADDLKHPLCAALHRDLLSRSVIGGEDRDLIGYPAESIVDRPVSTTAGEAFSEMMEDLEAAMREGQAVNVIKVRDPWGGGGAERLAQPDQPGPSEQPIKPEFKDRRSQRYTLYPLQFVYYQTAWYLLAEDVSDGAFKNFRLDRFKRAVLPSDLSPRGTSLQLKALREARKLLARGWGITMPRPGEPPVRIEVRFTGAARHFIEEYDRTLHETLEVTKGRGREGTRLKLRLPESTHWEFERWLIRWVPDFEVVRPQAMAERIWRLLEVAVSRRWILLRDNRG